MAARENTARAGKRAGKTVLADLSDAVQDYLREIYKLQAESGRVKTSTLAQQMGVAAAFGDGNGEEARSARTRGP